MSTETNRKRIKDLINQTQETVTNLDIKRSALNKEINIQMDQLHRYENCLSNNHRYSKAMNQPYPRLCVDCGESETTK